MEKYRFGAGVCAATLMIVVAGCREEDKARPAPEKTADTMSRAEDTARTAEAGDGGAAAGMAAAEQAPVPAPDPAAALKLVPRAGLTAHDWPDEAGSLSATAWAHFGPVGVFPGTGSLALSEEDLVLPVGETTFSFSRTYSPSSKGAFGERWRHGFGPAAVLCGQPGYGCDEQGRVRSIAAGESVLRVKWSKDRVEEVADGTAAVVKLSYDEAGRIVAVEGTGGAAVRYTYDASGRLVKREGRGATVEYAYDEKGRLASRGGDEGAVRVSYDGAGRVARVEGPGKLSSVVEYAATADGVVCRVLDALGHATLFAFRRGGTEVEVVDPAGGRSFKRFDAAGCAVFHRDPAGQVHEFNWDAAGRLTGVVRPDKRRVELTYDGGMLAGIREGRRAAKFEYDGQKRLSSFTDEDGRTWRYEYDGAGRLAAEVQPDGARQTVERDDQGRIAAVDDGRGRKERRTFDDAGRVVSFTDAGGRTTHLTYDEAGNLESITDPLGQKEEWTWDRAGRVATWRDKGKRTTKYRYNALGLVEEAGRSDGGVVRTEHDATGRPVAVQEGGRRSTMSYDAAGRLAEVKDETGTTGYEVDPLGRVVAVRREGRAVWAGRYDVEGRLVQEATSNGVTTRKLDEQGRLIEESGPDGRQTISHEPDGTVRVVGVGTGWTQVLRPLGPGGDLRVAEVTGPLGYRETWSYDLFGQPVVKEVAGGETAKWEYDALHRPVQTVSSLAGTTRYTWDPQDRPASVTDAAGFARTFTYGPGGYLQSVTSGPATVRYGNDQYGRLTSVTDAGGRTWRFEYDQAGRLSMRGNPDGSIERAEWDAAGRLSAWTRADGKQDRFEHDAAGRLLRWTADGQVMRELEYDAAGRPTLDQGPGHRVRMTHAPDGRLQSASDERAGVTLQYLYELGSRLSQVRLDAVTSTRYTYDDAGRLVGAFGPSGAEVRIEYDGQGRRERVRLGTGATLTYVRDDAGRVVEWKVATVAGTALLQASYGYDAAGRLEDQSLGEAIWLFGYDAGRRLQAATLPQKGKQSYSYDASGELVLAGGQAVTRGLSGEPLRGADGPRTFSVNGDMTGRPAAGGGTGAPAGGGAVSLEYDAGGRLVAVRSGTEEVARFEYDGSGNLTWTSGRSGQQRFLLDRGEVVAAVQGPGVPRWYLLSPDGRERLAVVEDGQVYYFVSDLNGSVLALVDASGRVRSRYTYEPFGRPLTVAEEVPNAFRFQGRYTDPATGLVHFPARWYDPEVASFLQPDPSPGELLRPETLSRYAFLDNDPVNRIDPAGLQAYEWAPGMKSLEQVCDLFQAGKIQGTYVSGKALDGYKYIGAIENKAGWVHDVWVKRVPGSDKVLTIFRDLNEKSEGFYGKPNFTGNLMVPQTPTPAPTPAPAAAQPSSAAPQSGGFFNSIREGFQNVKHGMQLYGKEITGTVGALGGVWGTLNTGLSTLAALPGGATIIGIGAALAGLGGYAVGTVINKSETVQGGTQSIVGKVMGYDKEQVMVNLETHDKAAGPKMLAGETKKTAENMKKLEATGMPIMDPNTGAPAAGTLDLGPPGGGKHKKPGPGAGAGADGGKSPGQDVKSEPRDVTEQPDAGGKDTDGHTDSKPADVSGDILAYVTPQKVSITYTKEVDASAGEFKNIVTCVGTISFWNVGSMVPGMGAATSTSRCTASLNGATSEGTASGTFTGGPNGTFTFTWEDGAKTFSLQNGASATIPDLGTFPVSNPAAFANWPREFQ